MYDHAVGMPHAATLDPLRYPDVTGVLITGSGYESWARASWLFERILSFPTSKRWRCSAGQADSDFRTLSMRLCITELQKMNFNAN